MSSDRKLYLVLYDLSNPKRLQKVHRQVSAYAIGGQKSFFECWLRPSELSELMERLRTICCEEEDRIHFLQLDPRELRLLLGTVRRQSIDPFLVI